MKRNLSQKIVSAVRFRILSIEQEVSIIDEEIPLISQSPGTTELEQTILTLQRNVKAVLHDVLLAYYKHFTKICPSSATLISVVTKYHLIAMKQNDISILLNELFGSQSALNTYVGQDYYKYSRDYDVSEDYQLRLIAQVFPFEYEHELLTDSSFFQFLLELIDQYQIQHHEQLLAQLFERIQNQKPKVKSYFFTADKPLYFALAEHFISVFTSNQMHHYHWDPLENFSIYQKCRLIVKQGSLSCSCDPKIISLLKSSKDDESLLRIIHKEVPFNLDKSIYLRSFQSLFCQLNVGEISSPRSSPSSPVRKTVRSQSCGMSSSDNILKMIESQSDLNSEPDLNSDNTNSQNESTTATLTDSNDWDQAKSSNPSNSNEIQALSHSNSNEIQTLSHSNSNEIQSLSHSNSNEIQSPSHSNSNEIQSPSNSHEINTSKHVDNSNENIHLSQKSVEIEVPIKNIHSCNSFIDSNSSYTSSISATDSKSTNTNSITDSSNQITEETITEDDIDQLTKKIQFTGQELPQLWHVSLDLMRMKYQTSPSFVICILANALNSLTKAITLDGNPVGGYETLTFLVYCIALTQPESLPSLSAYAERFVDSGLKEETKFGYLITQLQGALEFIQERVLAVPPFLVFPFEQVPIQHVAIMKPIETNILFRGFRIFAFPSFVRENEEILPAFLQYTGNDNDVAICTSFHIDTTKQLRLHSTSALNDSSNIQLKATKSSDTSFKVFPLNLPDLDIIPTIHGSFLQLTGNYINSHNMILIDNGNVEDTVESINALSAMMKMMPERDLRKLGPPKLEILSAAFKLVVKRWKTLIVPKSVQKYLENEDDANIIDIQKDLDPIQLNRLEIDSIQNIIAQIQRCLIILNSGDLTVNGVLNSKTWNAIKERFKLKDTDYIKPTMYEQLLKKTNLT